MTLCKSCLTVTTALLFPLSLPAMAAGTGNSLVTSALETGVILFFVLGLFLALVFLMKRLRSFSAGGSQMQLLETLSLGRNEKLCRVKMGNRVVIIGVTPGGISQLFDPSNELHEQQGHTTATQTTDLAEAVTYQNPINSFSKILTSCRSAIGRPEKNEASQLARRCTEVSEQCR